MYIVIVKLLDVIARAGFTVGATYMLPLSEAGRFGIITTLVGLFAFAFGWERYIDIQRRMVGAPPAALDAEVSDALKMSSFNYLVLLPIFLLVTAQWVRIGPEFVLLCAVVVVSEQLSNMIYQFSLVERRYYKLLTLVTIKNLAIAVIMAGTALFSPGLLSLGFVLGLWAAASLVTTLILALLWVRLRHQRVGADKMTLRSRIFAQHRASLAHFGIGLLAILMLQFDRLAVGGLLPFEDAGVYFRHILIVSFAYQFFNIAFYNRVLPEIFAKSRSGEHACASKVIRRELIWLVILVALAFGILWFVDLATNEYWSGRFSISLTLAGLLLLAAVIRIAADFKGLVLNANMLERILLRQQAIAFGIGSMLLIILTYSFGTTGTASASIATASLYLFLNSRAIRRRVGNGI